MGALRAIALSLVIVVGGCVAPGPPFARIAATIPPVPRNMARIYFYRWLEPYETTDPTIAYLNGRPVGVTETGAVFYRDVAPGQYTISVQSDEIYPYQFKTVVLTPGEVAYARIESLRTWSSCGGGGDGDSGGGVIGCLNTFVVRLIDPVLARGEMADLQFIQG
jgi:hypothetical protein